MATTSNSKKVMKKTWMVTKINQVMKRWKSICFKLPRALPSSLPDFGSWTSPTSSPYIPSGFLEIYVGLERLRFLILTRLLNFPIFIALLQEAEEEYGFKFSGEIALPCEVDLLKKDLKFLDEDEKK